VAYLEETEAINWYDRIYTGKDKNTGKKVSLILTDKGWRQTEPLRQGSEGEDQ